MSRSTYRPRRSRIYGANYDIGESYYKKQLEELDNKQGVNRLSVDQPFNTDYSLKEDRSTPKVSFQHDAEDDDLFKYTSSSRAAKNKSYLDDFDDEALSSNIKFSSKLDTSDSVKFGESSIKEDILKKVHDMRVQTKERKPFDLEDKLQDGFSARRLKIRTETLFEEGNALAEQASSRAKATKARLAELESDMFSRTEKQNEREQRNFSLKKLLSESDTETTSKSLKKITF